MTEIEHRDSMTDEADIGTTLKEQIAAAAPSSRDPTPEKKTDNAQTGALVQYWADRALTFVSQASNETLGACFVGLGATTYLVLGRVGLVLIGVVGGIALHATWEKSTLGPSEAGDAGEREARKRRELGLEVVQRVLDWRDRRRAESELKDADHEEDVEVKLMQGKTLDFADFQPETAAALDVFTTAVIRDYVKWWYSPVLPAEEAFPTASRQVLTAFLLSFSNHLSRKRPAEIFINFTINSSSVVVAILGELASALGASPNTDAASAIDTYIQLKPESSLANMLDQAAQDKKLTLVAEDILQNFLDPKAYNLPVAHIFLRQILSKLILGMTLETCSKADWINGWIVYLLEEGEPELLQVIDDGIEQSSKGKTAAKSAAAESQAEAKVAEHNRQKSKAEDAMEEAMQEARRLTLLIQEEEEARRLQSQTDAISSNGDMSESAGIKTPTSSQSELDKADRVAEHVAPAAETTEDMLPSSSQDDQQQFTNFDQLGPSVAITHEEEERPVLTLHNVKISIIDDSVPGEKSKMKSKPTGDYLIQIEPADSRLSGWMIARKYSDFEVVHEVLRRISVITGVRFVDMHPSLPSWKSLDKPTFRFDLEKYLTDAVKFQPLAESEGMKRFLAKDQGLAKQPTKGLGWPVPLQMGKGVFDVLAKAPKEVAGGGKALFGNVTNALNPVKRPSMPAGRTTSSNSLSMSNGSPQPPRQSTDARRRIMSETARASTESFDRPDSTNGSTQDLRSMSLATPEKSSLSRPSVDIDTDVKPAPDRPTVTSAGSMISLPPPPSAIDQYESPGGISPLTQTKYQTIVDPSFPEISSQQEVTAAVPQPSTDGDAKRPQRKIKTLDDPLTEREANVIVDLFFAVISELYTLSSAWTFRRTLLQAARTFILRPGNPQLEAIRVLMQGSVIDANSSDAGMANMILKTRENSLPTEEELKLWPPPLKADESEALRVKARKLLVEKGMPVALTSVMGAAATGEALGRVFDCLQAQPVAKSLMFGLMLQALRAVVQ